MFVTLTDVSPGWSVYFIYSFLEQSNGYVILNQTEKLTFPQPRLRNQRPMDGHALIAGGEAI